MVAHAQHELVAARVAGIVKSTPFHRGPHGVAVDRHPTDCGSTPDPASVAETTTAPRVETSRSLGGVVSSIQKRNVNGPAASAERVSKTML